MEIKEVIKTYLKEKSSYEQVDDLLIDELVFNYDIMKQCKEDLYDVETMRFELLSDITRDPDKEPFLQKNRLLDIYNNAFKAVKDCYVKLGLTTQERFKMKLAILEAGDASFTLYGGHTYEILDEGTIVYEYKTGPYEGQALDKTFIKDGRH